MRGFCDSGGGRVREYREMGYGKVGERGGEGERGEEGAWGDVGVYNGWEWEWEWEYERIHGWGREFHGRGSESESGSGEEWEWECMGLSFLGVRYGDIYYFELGRGSVWECMG